MVTDIVTLTNKVREMREAQKEYARTFASTAKVKAARLESEVDSMIKEVGVPSRTSTQPNLF